MKNTILKTLKKERLRAFRLLAAVVLLSLTTNLAFASAYEPFNYPPGTPITAGLNGGTGWSGAWIGGSGAITNPGLLPGSGNALGPMGAYTKRYLAEPIKECSMRMSVLIKSPTAGTPASQATVGNVDGLPNGHFIIGDLPMPDATAGNWGLQNNYYRRYSTKPVVAGQTVYLVAQIDFTPGNVSDNDRMRLWVNPPTSGAFPPADIDVTEASVTSFSGVFWQTQQQQSVDEIRIEKLPCQTELPQDGCCDTLRVTPYPNPPLNQDYRTFEVFNPLPSSPICSIDIDMSPLPPTTNWQGGQAFQNLGSGGTPVNFTFASLPPAYRRIPTLAPNMMNAISNPLSAPAVKFNLGFDNTQYYNGKTILTINHCDGRKCVVEYKPWIVNPAVLTGGGGLPWRINVRELSAELLEVMLTYDGGRSKTELPRDAKGARWLGFRLLNEGAEIYSIDGAEIADGKKENRKLSLSSSTKTANAALFEFNGLLNFENRQQNGKTITLLVTRKNGGKFDSKDVGLTLFDENANVIASGAPQQ